MVEKQAGRESNVASRFTQWPGTTVPGSASIASHRAVNSAVRSRRGKPAHVSIDCWTRLSGSGGGLDADEAAVRRK